MVLNTEWAQVEVIDLINDGSGLAFGIIGGRSTGVVVKTILPGGVADRDGRLQSGDHILQIGEVNLRGLGSEQVASVLRQCGVHVRMVVARPIESANSDYQPIGISQAPIVPTKILGDPVELDRHLIENGYAEAFSYHPPQQHFENNPYIYATHHSEVQLHGLSTMIDAVRDPLTVPYFHQQPLNDIPNDSKEDALPETETYTVELQKDDLGLGITVAGYVCEKEEISGIFVKSISKGSAADLTNNIKINDRIVEVDGKSVIGYTNHQAVELLRNTGSIVTIKLERYLRGPKYEQLQQAIRANELRPPSPMSPTTVSSLPKVPLSSAQMDFLIIEPDGESRTSFEFDSAILMEAITPINEEKEIVIGTERRALQFVISSYETIYAKWREKLDDNVEIVISQLQKEPDSGLGISLEGTVDVEDGKEVRPHHYIRNILPDGPVGKNGILQSGDELLEVNGVQLLGLNHLEVVSILKQLPNFVSLVCVRYPTPIRIIDTSQHREAFQARKILAGSLQTLIPTTDNNHLVKAKSETSLASSAASEVTRSKSLELIAGLPMWSDEATVIELIKGEHGLGFSILDYQDPLNPQESVIVVRSLVPGGVAQTDGRLIPGDRLLNVNGTDLEHATLDRAVQVLKGTPRGAVRITVAKPLGSNDGCVSHASQFVRELLRQWSDEVGYVFASDTEEDQTCLEDFQECIDEFQECLDVVHICLEDDRSFNHSPCSSQLEDMDQKPSRTDFVENNYLYVKNVTDSEVDVSFKSTSDNIKPNLVKTCSFTQSDKPSIVSDGYDTCLDESLSEDNKKIKFRAETDVNRCRLQTIDANFGKVNALEDLTPTNSRMNIMDQFFLEKHEKLQQTSTNAVIIAVSEPCLNKDEFSYRHRLCLDTKLDDGLKSYDNQSTDLGGDEFFLIQYPHESPKEVCKSRSEPNVLDNMEATVQRPIRKCLKEYYNDYADCLEVYRLQCERIAEEGSNEGNDNEEDDDIFSGIVVPFKSRSMSDVTGSSFVMVTYDPGPDLNRRKSAFVAGEQFDKGEMTVIRPLDGDLKGCQVEEMLQKHWGSTHTVKVYREPNKSLGISIVGGKVDIQASDKPSDSLLGIFVKNVVQDSPAGKTGQFKTGDRILEVSGVNLRQASHEKAVQAIRNASNPVTFVIQSLLPWKFTDNVSNQQNNNELYSCPSPYPSPVSVKSPYQTQNDLNNERPLLQTVPEDGGKNLSPIVTHVTPIHAPASPKIQVPRDGTEERSPSVSDLVSDEENVDQVKPPRAIESDDEEDDDDDEEDERELEGRTTTTKGQQIDRASAGNVRRSKEEIAADPEEENEYGYTKNKVKKKYASLGHTIMMVQMERSSHGLGLSLAGHKDRNCMAVFVCGINPHGAAYKAGQIQIGDEILEVNGVVLHGRCHLNAAAIIKGLSGPVFNVIILRRKTAIDDIAVKPITQFPILLAEEASEEQFSATYPNVRTVAIKKGTHSLGIMIIEGKHAEVGQGIFISDIQEGSSAEKAGLEIGEMILAVNKDSLVGSNYDNAASLLKRTEGLVTLVVSNPGKKDSTSNAQGPCNSGSDKNAALKSSSTLKPTVPPSRPTTPVPEPVADPLTCQIVPGRDTSIEIVTDNKNLGIFFIGGKDTPISTGIVIVEVYPGGTADKDNRLQPGDQILEVNGTSLKDVTHTTASQALRQTLPKMKMIVYRPATIEYTTVETDLIKKPGKGLGLSILARKSGKGVYVADVINGGTADLDGKIVKGDLLVSVNGQSVENSNGEEAGAILKTVSGKVALKLHRYKLTSR